MKGGIFSMLFNLTFTRSSNGKFYKFVSVGVLTRRPEGEVSGISRRPSTRAIQSARARSKSNEEHG